MTKKFKDKDGKHIPYIEGKDFLGTARFSSVYTHLGIEQSRRDDIESIGYVLVYLFKGTLPWFDLEGTNKKQKYFKIMELKRDLIYEEFCKEMPSEFVDYFKYTRALQFDQAPDYEYLRSLIKSAASKSNIKLDYEYDWEERSKRIITSDNINDYNSSNKKYINDFSFEEIKYNILKDENNQTCIDSKSNNENLEQKELIDSNSRTTSVKCESSININKSIVNKIIFGNNKFLVNK